jgi:ribonucleotide monophosphatase NagD (HAD superfamily)
VRTGAAFVAVNLDPRLPVEAGEFFLGAAPRRGGGGAAGVRPGRQPEPHLFRRAGAFGCRRRSWSGDSIHSDICGAQGVGLRTIWIAPSDSDAGDVRPDLTIRAYAELLPKL